MGYIKGGLIGLIIGSVVLAGTLEAEGASKRKRKVTQPVATQQAEAPQTAPAQSKYQLSPKGLDFIKNYEKFSPTVYSDAANKPTMGYGHLILPGERFSTITKEEGEALLRKDLTKYERAVNTNITAPLTQWQYDALVSFAYNTGVGSINPKKSSLVGILNSQDYDRAANKMAEWNKITKNGKKIVNKGLVNRRTDEIEMFTLGDYVRNH